MGFKWKLTSLIPLLLLLTSPGYGNKYWVKYGWTVFDEAGDARSVALGSTISAAPGSFNSSFVNPSARFSSGSSKITYAHHTRYAGMISSDYLSFPYRSVIGLPVVFHLINEQIQNIPDTRQMLLDWGNDGEPGTNDAGEGNGILDEGERLDASKLRTFDQSQWGLQLSTSLKFRTMYVGLAVKGLFHALGDRYSNGIGFNIGARKSLWRGNTVALVIRDFTTSWLVWDSGTVERTRPSMIAGLSQVVRFERLPVNLVLLTGLVVRPFERTAGDDVQLLRSGANYRLGFEAAYKDRVFIQFGRNQTGFLSTGLGIQWDEIGLHYAYQASPNVSLGQSHYISILLDPDMVWRWFN